MWQASAPDRLSLHDKDQKEQLCLFVKYEGCLADVHSGTCDPILFVLMIMERQPARSFSPPIKTVTTRFNKKIDIYDTLNYKSYIQYIC